MRVAILADIRANQSALQAVLRHVAGAGIDKIWFIGNQFSYGPDPSAIADTLHRSPHNDRCLVGHLDGAILHWPKSHAVNPAIRPGLAWAHSQLRPPFWSRWSSRWHWLRSLRCAGEGDGLQFFSGTPLDPEAGFLPVEPGNHPTPSLGPHLDVVRAGAFIGMLGRQGLVMADDLRWRDADPGEPLAIDGRRFLACPGSVGQPRDGDARAGYAVHDGATITWHRVVYDVQETTRRIAAHTELAPSNAMRLLVGK